MNGIKTRVAPCSKPIVLRDGKYRIRSQSEGGYLDIALGGSGNGARVHVHGEHDGTSAIWFLKRDKDGGYRIRNTSNKRYLDVRHKSKKDGARVHLWTKVSTRSQHWEIISASEDGLFTIKNRRSGKFLDLELRDAGSSARQRRSSSEPTQRWYLERLRSEHRYNAIFEIRSLERFAAKRFGLTVARIVKAATRNNFMRKKLNSRFAAMIDKHLSELDLETKIQLSKKGAIRVEILDVDQKLDGIVKDRFGDNIELKFVHQDH